jgi:hypothetical protein
VIFLTAQGTEINNETCVEINELQASTSFTSVGQAVNTPISGTDIFIVRFNNGTPRYMCFENLNVSNQHVYFYKVE